MTLDRERAGLRRVLVVGDDAVAVSDIGCVRDCNEDAVWVDPRGVLLVLADGLGGLPAGEVASGIAVETVAAILCSHEERSVSEETVRTRLAEAFEAASARVLAEAEARGRRGMATTLGVAWISDDELFCSHVGDVRAYLLRGSTIDRLTDDHTVAGELVAAGRISEEAIRSHPERNALTRAIGFAGHAQPSFVGTRLVSGDVVLLCSDGLWEPVGDHELAAARQRIMADPREGAVGLVDLAVDRGGDDNITIVVRCAR